MTKPAFLPTRRIAAAAILCLAAGACTHGSDTASLSLEQSVAGGSSANDAMALAPSHAASGAATRTPIASLPEEAVASVRAHAYVNGLRQDIMLKGGSPKMQNSITVLARTSATPTLDETVPLYKPSEAGIRSEIGAQFPHIAMQVAERESSNAYGPYGLALGRAGGDMRCLFMWQWIDENRLQREAMVKGPMSVRVRLCRSGTTFDAMAAEMDKLTIGAASADGVASDDTIHVITAPAEANAESPKPKRKRIAAHRRRDTRVAKAPETETIPSPAPSQYLAPTPVAAATIPHPVVSTANLSDLPSQAYLGPKSAKTN